MPTQQENTQAGELAIENLSTELPLTLFPVRLATRFQKSDDGTPTKLLLRIYPDLIHADGHLEQLTDNEVAIGKAYWTLLWRAGGDARMRDDAHRWLVDQVGAPRGAWISKMLAPTNPADAPRNPLKPDEELKTEPSFPKAKTREMPRATIARLLPDRWYVTMRRGVEHIVRRWSGPVQRDLAMAPNLVDMPASGDIRDFLKAQDLWWMKDFSTAVTAGMAMRIPWRQNWGADHVTELTVLGVRDGNAGDADELADLLNAHRFSTGLDFVPQGTPTNNTDTVAAGFTEVPDDLEGYLGRQLATPTVRRPSLKPAHRLGVATAANATSIALGLTDRNALDHADNGEMNDGKSARAMNRVLWPTTIGRLLRELMAMNNQPLLGDQDLVWLENWFRDWVKGAGLLPALRIGEQPYGLLPVARRRWVFDGYNPAPKRSDKLQDRLAFNRGWSDPAQLAAHFSDLLWQGGRGRPTPEQEAETLAGVLGAVPHPLAFRLRDAFHRYDEIADAWNSAIDEMDALIALTPSRFEDSIYRGTVEYEDQIKYGSLGTQHARLGQFSGVALDDYEYFGQETVLDVHHHVDNVVRPLTEAHQIRTSVAGSYYDDFPDAAHLPDPNDPPLWYVEYGEDEAQPDGTFPELKLVSDEDPDALVKRLRNLANRARALRQRGPRRIVDLGDAPLFDWLLVNSLHVVPYERRGEFATGLEDLAAMVEEKGAAGIDQLRRQLRETLGLAGHRLDAWHSSVANQRLARLRANNPTGAQVGAYGWIENLTPDDDGGPDSEGFIHAPSLDHATTAGVLRSAWLHYANSNQDAPFSVDLSSDRVRRAMWLLDGVRNGVELGELLGSRLERRLHDGDLSHLIADVRERVLTGQGLGSRQARAIVDGLAVAVAYADSTVGDPVRAELELLRKSLGPALGQQLDTVLKETVADLDSTTDVLTAQAVHGVTRGQLGEAAATLSVAGAGDSGIPPITLPDVHRESQVITHRLLAVLPVQAAAKATTPLAAAEPRLSRWLTQLLPPVSELVVEANVEGYGDWSSTMLKLGIGAPELVALSAVGGGLAGSQLGTLLAGVARAAHNAPPETAVTFGGPELAEALIVAGALRGAIGLARPLGANDLTNVATEASQVDTAELETRRSRVITDLTNLAKREPTPDELRQHLGSWAVIDPGLVAAVLADETRSKELSTRLEEVVTVLQEGKEPALDLLSNAFMAGIPILPTFTPTNPTELRDGFAGTARRLGGPVQAMSWLLQTGTVHRSVGLWAEALDLAEAVKPEAEADFSIAQLPDDEAETWVAVQRPKQQDSVLHLFSVTNGEAAMESQKVAGLLLDAWTEPIPGGDATTGVAVHFDKPGAKPPQAVLLAAPPDDGGPWTTDELEVILTQTFELARLRAVGPERMSRWGHYLPAVYLDEQTSVATIEEDG